MKRPRFLSEGCRYDGFSVLELLVVIAMISVLAAMLFPVVGALRERSAAAVCLGNLRQIGAAFQGYASDHNGILPQNNEGGESWYQAIDSYAGYSYGTIYTEGDAAISAGRVPKLARKSILHCPSEKEIQRPYACYSINRELDVGVSKESARIPQLSIVSPSKYVVVVDSFKAAKIYTDSKSKMVEWNFMKRRHGGMPNFLYADWHAAPFDQPIVGLSDAGGKDPFYQTLWLARYQP